MSTIELKFILQYRFCPLLYPTPHAKNCREWRRVKMFLTRPSVSQSVLLLQMYTLLRSCGGGVLLFLTRQLVSQSVRQPLFGLHRSSRTLDRYLGHNL